MSKKHRPEPIIDRFQLTTDKEVDQHIAARDQQTRANERAARHFADLADVARQRLNATRNGAEAIARIESIRSGTPDDETVTLAQAMEVAERSAAATVENYLRQAGGLIEALYHCLPFSQELQKLALDARKRLAALHMVSPNGEMPTGTTINGDGKNLPTHVTVYSTSRPAFRWVMDDSVTFHDLAGQIQADTHCDCSEEPFRKSLAAHKRIGKADCIQDLADSAANQRKVSDYWANELETVAEQWKDKIKRPDPVSVGLLFPVAFGSDIVVLKLCIDHVVALAEKYSIKLRGCGIEEPWEGTGNYW